MKLWNKKIPLIAKSLASTSPMNKPKNQLKSWNRSKLHNKTNSIPHPHPTLMISQIPPHHNHPPNPPTLCLCLCRRRRSNIFKMICQLRQLTILKSMMQIYRYRNRMFDMVMGLCNCNNNNCKLIHNNQKHMDLSKHILNHKVERNSSRNMNKKRNKIKTNNTIMTTENKKKTMKKNKNKMCNKFLNNLLSKLLNPKFLCSNKTPHKPIKMEIKILTLWNNKQM